MTAALSHIHTRACFPCLQHSGEELHPAVQSVCRSLDALIYVIDSGPRPAAAGAAGAGAGAGAAGAGGAAGAHSADALRAELDLFLDHRWTG